MNNNPLKYYFSLYDNGRFAYYVIFSMFSIMIGFLVGYSIYIAFAITISLGIILFIYKSPIKVLSLLILVSPFAGTIYFGSAFINIPGFKPITIIGVLIIIISLLNIGSSEKMPKYSFYFILAMFIIFTISIIRSLPNLNVFNKYYWFEDPLSKTRYILSDYIKPLIFLLPFIIIIKFVKTKEDLEFVLNTIYITLILFSFHHLYIYLSCIKINMNIVQISDYYETYYGLHRNDLATFYVVGLPIAFRKYFLNRKFYNGIFLLLIITDIGFLFSRTAYVTTLIAIFLYLAFTKRTKYILITILISVLISFIISGVIVERATTGFKTKDRDTVSAGRIDKIWIPLIKEYSNNPKKLFFGNGRYAMRASDAASKGTILRANEPHNMYLELFLDAGIFCLILVLLFYIYFVRYTYKCLSFANDENLKENIYAFIVSIMCFLASGFTGSSFFPRLETIFIWVILGCTIASCRIVSNIENNILIN